MKILSLDPGITTGYALIGDGGVLLESGNIDIDDLQDSILVEYAKDPELVVVRELIPIPTNGKMNGRLLDCVSWLTSTFSTAATIRPGQWKPNKFVANYPFPDSKFPQPSPHQRDAFRLGIFYLVYILKEAPDGI